MGASLSPPTASTGAAEAARRFLRAVVWGEHTRLWAMLSPKGRAAAISVAVANGMDRVAAGRIRDGLADPAEFDDFLRQLLVGLRRDMRSVDLENVTLAGEPGPGPEDGSVTVELATPSTLPGTEAWPAGRLVLSCGPEGDWGVDRLEPRLAGP